MSKIHPIYYFFRHASTSLHIHLTFTTPALKLPQHKRHRENSFLQLLFQHSMQWKVIFFLVVLWIEKTESGFFHTPQQNLVYDQIYSSGGGYGCSSLLDKTRAIGCRLEDGSKTVGELRPLETEEDLNLFEEKGFQTENAVVPVVKWKIWVHAVSILVNKIDQIAGVLVDFSEEGEKPLFYSPDDVYPNKAFGLYPNSTFEWNPHGTGISFLSVRVPVFAIRHRRDSELLFRSARLNRENEPTFPMFAELDALSSAPTSPEQCLLLRECAPLGGRSVISSLSSPRHSAPIVLAVASIDSSAFFSELSVGANSEMSSLVVLLTAYDSLRTNSFSLVDLPNQVLFGFFNGEAYGYIGSRKFVSDLTEFECFQKNKHGNSCEKPKKSSLNFTQINFSSIFQILELKQVTVLLFCVVLIYMRLTAMQPIGGR